MKEELDGANGQKGGKEGAGQGMEEWRGKKGEPSTHHDAGS